MRVSTAAFLAIVLSASALFVWSQTKPTVPIQLSSPAKASNSLSDVLGLHSAPGVRDLPSQAFDAH